MAACPMAPDGSPGQFGPIRGIASKCRDDTGASAPASPDAPIDTATSTAIAIQTPGRLAELLMVQPSRAWGPSAWSVTVSETAPAHHEPPPDPLTCPAPTRTITATMARREYGWSWPWGSKSPEPPRI